MKNNKEDYSDKPISQSDSPDTTDNSDRPETARPQSPAGLSRSRSIFIDLFTSTPKAWQKTEAKLLGEESQEELSAKRDIFIAL